MSRRVIVINGTNNGIGYHMTKKLLQKGCYLACLDINTDQLIPRTVLHRLLIDELFTMIDNIDSKNDFA
ncbi:MAG TPA: hypothetical protein VKA34_21575 [Balneolales bacterium]|nr:hypothetical protein [Balneolales bacterium]